MLLPSAIQRADDLVGIEMPIVPLSCAPAPGAAPIRPASASAAAKPFNAFTTALLFTFVSSWWIAWIRLTAGGARVWIPQQTYADPGRLCGAGLVGRTIESFAIAIQ